MKINKTILIFIFFVLISTISFSQESEINATLNQWHKDVANSNYGAYFNKMSENSVFIGTDAGEIWDKQQFKDFAKPYFDKKETWNFTPLSRNIYFSSNQNIAWFDELLETWMGICRGSGVLIREHNKWVIAHYVLSVTIPNDDMKKVISDKKINDSIVLKKLKIK
ncbi:MAG: nuclear transport factor 2 family protein [Bacteroidota bacterium]